MSCIKKGKVRPKDKKLKPIGETGTQQQFVEVGDMSSLSEADKAVPTIIMIKRKHLLNEMKKRLKYLIVPSIVPASVAENWEENSHAASTEEKEIFERQSFDSELSYRFWYWKFVKIFESILMIIFLWMTSTELTFLHYFGPNIETGIFSIEWKAGICSMIILKVFIQQMLIKMLKNEKQQQLQQNSKQIGYQWYSFELYNDVVGPLINFLCCVGYLSIHSLGELSIRYIIQSIIIIVLFRKVWNIKESIEPIINYIETINYRNQFRIVMMFFLVIGICHIFALIMYLMTYIYPKSNWLTENSLKIPEEGWHVHYVHSLYFAMTTMATVGYGDLVPTQYYEMIIVTLIQLFGTAMFGYMINVIGLTVAEMNQKNEQFDNYINIINKLQSHYQISRQLCRKFKNSIIQYESIMKETPLSASEENKFFKCIEPALKDSFLLETNMRIIKKSIFFLTHFTVNFQNQIALKLVRRIYNKNEKIELVLEEQSIDKDWDREKEREKEKEKEKERYMAIINSGSVDIDITCQTNNIELNKFIKTIQPIEGKPTLNVFGYSSVIMNKDINLIATAKQITSVYLLARKDVLECMNKNMLDFEGVSQLRERMLQYSNLSHVEAQSVHDIERHYIPNIFLINKKTKLYKQNREKSYERSSRRTRIKLITLQNFQYRTMMCIDLDEEKESIKPLSPRNLSDLSGEQIIDEEQKAVLEVESMDQYKNYENFMKKSNIHHLLPIYHEYLKKTRKIYRVQLKTMINSKALIRTNKNKMNTYSEGVEKKDID